MWSEPVRVLFIETKGSTNLPYHVAVGDAIMHPPVVINTEQATATINDWPEHIKQDAEKLLLNAKSAKFKSFALTEKHLFEKPVKVNVPSGCVTFTRGFKLDD
jgi:hypothetical protein